VDGNPVGTEYAIGTSNLVDGVQYLSDESAVQEEATWQPLPDWGGTNGLLVQGLNIAVTNWFFLVAQNNDGVGTDSGPASDVIFELAIEPLSADQLDDGQGFVEAKITLINPLTNNCSVVLSYSTDKNAPWPWPAATVTEASAAYGEPKIVDGVITDVPTHIGLTNTLTVVWNARTNLGSVVTNIWLAWDAQPAEGIPAERAIFPDAGLLLDLEPPSVDSVVCEFAPGPTNAAPIPFTVTFSEPVFDFTTNGITVAGGTIEASDAPSTSDGGTNWTFSVTPSAGEVYVAVTKIEMGAAKDAAGNLSKVWDGDEGVFFDEVDPEITNIGANPGFATTGTVVTLTFDATDASGIPANPVVTVNDHAADFDRTNTRCSRRIPMVRRRSR